LRFKARIEVGMKGGHADPESETIKRTLIDLNFPILGVRTKKVYEITLQAGTKKDAESTVRMMCSRLLANPTKDEFRFEVEPTGNASASEA
jgi:phosphoribosylformylglycinamidine synthase subunit PurS